MENSEEKSESFISKILSEVTDNDSMSNWVLKTGLSPMDILTSEAKVRNLVVQYRLDHYFVKKGVGKMYVMHVLVTAKFLNPETKQFKHETKVYEGTSKTTREARFLAALEALKEIHLAAPGFAHKQGEIPEEWLQWLEINMNRGVDPEKLLSILHSKGFQPAKNEYVMSVMSVRGAVLKVKKETSASLRNCRVIPVEWQKWIEENLARGVKGDIILSELIKNGFDTEKHKLMAQRLARNHEAAVVSELHPKTLSFWRAAADGDCMTLRQFIAGGQDLEEESTLVGCRFTALGLAARNGHADASRVLVEAGANIDHMSALDMTPLMLACLKGALDVVIFLVSRSAGIHLTNKYGDTSLHIAASAGYRVIVDWILTYVEERLRRVFVSDAFRDRMRSMFREIQLEKLSQFKRQYFLKAWVHDAALRYLDELPDDVRAMVPRPSTQLSQFVILKHSPTDKDIKELDQASFVYLMQKLFTESFANNRNRIGRTPVHCACCPTQSLDLTPKHEDVIRCLVDTHGCEVSSTDLNGYTPLDHVQLRREEAEDRRKRHEGVPEIDVPDWENRGPEKYETKQIEGNWDDTDDKWLAMSTEGDNWVERYIEERRKQKIVRQLMNGEQHSDDDDKDSIFDESENEGYVDDNGDDDKENNMTVQSTTEEIEDNNNNDSNNNNSDEKNNSNSEKSENDDNEENATASEYDSEYESEYDESEYDTEEDGAEEEEKEKDQTEQDKDKDETNNNNHTTSNTNDQEQTNTASSQSPNNEQTTSNSEEQVQVQESNNSANENNDKNQNIINTNTPNTKPSSSPTEVSNTRNSPDSNPTKTNSATTIPHAVDFQLIAKQVPESISASNSLNSTMSKLSLDKTNSNNAPGQLVPLSKSNRRRLSLARRRPMDQLTMMTLEESRDRASKLNAFRKHTTGSGVHLHALTARLSLMLGNAAQRQREKSALCEWGCGKWILREDQEKHAKEECKKKVVPCLLGCGLTLRREQWDHFGTRHKEEDCIRRRVPCTKGCGDYVPFADMNHHLEFDCIRRPVPPVPCRLGCGLKFIVENDKLEKLKEEREAHEKYMCPHRPVVCDFCGVELKVKDRPQHRADHLANVGKITFAEPGVHSYSVMQGIFTLKVRLWGAGGGAGCCVGRKMGHGGGGMFVEAMIAVKPKEELIVVVGAGGQQGQVGVTETFGNKYLRTFHRPGRIGVAEGGVPGGGVGRSSNASFACGGGGGYSAICRKGPLGTELLAIAGGGGGGGSRCGGIVDDTCGKPGSQDDGGKAGVCPQEILDTLTTEAIRPTDGESYQGGDGASFGGGGGGGYFGGGGGGFYPGICGAGGHGSSFALGAEGKEDSVVFLEADGSFPAALDDDKRKAPENEGGLLCGQGGHAEQTSLEDGHCGAVAISVPLAGGHLFG